MFIFIKVIFCVLENNKNNSSSNFSRCNSNNSKCSNSGSSRNTRSRNNICSDKIAVMTVTAVVTLTLIIMKHAQVL